jgi:SAM-dependent methyltransferase
MRAYTSDVLAFTGKPMHELQRIAGEYTEKNLSRWDQNKIEEYYRGLGISQLARNFLFHNSDYMVDIGEFLLGLFNPAVPAYGLDFGCGSAPIGFELVLRGHSVDFIDIPGSYAEKFVKWRLEKRGIEGCGFAMGDGYHWVLMLDSIEHLPPDKFPEIFADIASRLRPGGSVITNYWSNHDFNNPEHINMNKPFVRDVFKQNGLVMHPVRKGKFAMDDIRWVKNAA